MDRALFPASCSKVHSLRSNIAAMAGTLNDITSEVVCMPDSDAFAVCFAVWVIW